MAIALLVGATWIHIDYLVIIVAFFLIGLVPLLGLVFVLFLVVFIGGLTNKQVGSCLKGVDTGLVVIDDEEFGD